MNNHNPYNSEQQPDERPFAYILKGALLPREGRNIDITQHRSAAPEYRGDGYYEIRFRTT